jgi:hypothetical protein
VLRAIATPLVTGYAVFVAMVLVARRRPVPRPRGLHAVTPRRLREMVETLVGGYIAFLAIVFVFHVWLAGERTGIAEAVWGGAFLSSLAVVTAMISSLIIRHTSKRA